MNKNIIFRDGFVGILEIVVYINSAINITISLFVNNHLFIGKRIIRVNVILVVIIVLKQY
ncbi:hypothetical protein U3516DRAFT_790558 [Neocallimastix sp. 'constans']